MRILQINKFFYRRGGAETVFFDTIQGLRKLGHEVAEFSMSDPKNLPSDYSAYFISRLPELLLAHDPASAWKIFKHLFYSKEVERKLKALILAAEPEVAQLHNVYHHLSASTFLILKKMRVPMILTAHDVFPLCPNHSLLYGETMGEKYFKNKLYNCIRYKCVNNQLLPSVAGTLEAYYYRWRKIWDMIDLFICPSRFMKDKMVEYGFPEKKMRLIANPYQSPEIIPPLGKQIVYLGRLHYEKGIKIFMAAARQLRDYDITVVGAGPEEKWVDEYIRRNNLSKVRRLGWVGGIEWKNVFAGARVVVVPSVFYENCSLSILEALSYGRIVVATNRGGNPELVIDGLTGFLARPEDPFDLARVIKQAMDLPAAEAEQMIRQGRNLVAKNHNPEQYFEKLLNVYKEAM